MKIPGIGITQTTPNCNKQNPRKQLSTDYTDYTDYTDFHRLNKELPCLA
jgi:hypothetical protein